MVWHINDPENHNTGSNTTEHMETCSWSAHSARVDPEQMSENMRTNSQSSIGSFSVIHMIESQVEGLKQCTWKVGRLLLAIGLVHGLVLAGTIAVLTLNVLFYIQCQDEMDRYRCAMTPGRNPCDPIIAVFSFASLALVGFIIFNIQAIKDVNPANHAMFLYAMFCVSGVICLIVLCLEMFLYTGTYITSTTYELIEAEMSHCSQVPLPCWQQFHTEFCEDWYLAQNETCGPILILQKLNVEFQTDNTTTGQIIQNCTEKFKMFMDHCSAHHLGSSLYTMHGCWLLYLLLTNTVFHLIKKLVGYIEEQYGDEYNKFIIFRCCDRKCTCKDLTR